MGSSSARWTYFYYLGPETYMCLVLEKSYPIFFHVYDVVITSWSTVSLNIKILKVHYEMISITKVIIIYLRVFTDVLGSDNDSKNIEIKKIEGGGSSVHICVWIND